MLQVTHNKSFESPYKVESKESYASFLKSLGLDHLISYDIKSSDLVKDDDDFEQWLRS